jgi:hypothetical protein
VGPEYSGKSVDAFLYRRLCETVGGRDIRMEINYILEDHCPMNNAVKSRGTKPLRRCRVRQ